MAVAWLLRQSRRRGARVPPLFRSPCVQRRATRPRSTASAARRQRTPCAACRPAAGWPSTASWARARAARSAGAAALLGSRTIGANAKGWDVAALQWLLATHGFPSGPFDGQLGATRRGRAPALPGWAGLGADGLAGPATYAALRRPPPRSVLNFARAARDRARRRLRPARRHDAPRHRLPRGERHARRRGRPRLRLLGRLRRRRLRQPRRHPAPRGHDELVRAPVADQRPAAGSASSRARGSAASARPATRPGRTCTSSCASAAPPSTR